MASQAQVKFIYKQDVPMKAAMGLLKEKTGWEPAGQMASEKMVRLMKARSPMEQEVMLSFSPMVTYKYICEAKLQDGKHHGILLSCTSHVIGFFSVIKFCFSYVHL